MKFCKSASAYSEILKNFAKSQKMQKKILFFACLALVAGSAFCWMPQGIKNMIDRGFIANLESKLKT